MNNILRNIFWKRQSELLIARYSAGEEVEKLENDFMQLLNDMPLYWNGNSGYIGMWDNCTLHRVKSVREKVCIKAK